MAWIKYTGLSHFRELLVEDFKKWELSVERHLFPRHEAVQVHDDVADALLKNLPDEFQAVPSDQAPADDSQAPATVNQPEPTQQSWFTPEASTPGQPEQGVEGSQAVGQ